MLKQSAIIILQRKFAFYLLNPFLKPNLRLTLLRLGQDENSRFVFTEITNGETPNVYSSISTFLVLSTCAWSVSKRKILSVWLYYRSTNSSCFQFWEGFADIVFVPWWGFVQWRGHHHAIDQCILAGLVCQMWSSWFGCVWIAWLSILL